MCKEKAGIDGKERVENVAEMEGETGKRRIKRGRQS